MLEYMRKHWVGYLVGATIAALLGLGFSFYLGQKWSTPESVRAQRIEQERERDKNLGNIQMQESEVPDDQEAAEDPEGSE